ncbi:hypothetical protein D3C80_1823880 [compost metagenome]
MRGTQQDEVSQGVGFVLDLGRQDGSLRPVVGVAHDKDPVHLPGAQRGPAWLIGFGDIEDVVMRVLDAREPLGG